MTFNDVLKLPVAVPELLGGLVGLGGLPPTAVPPGGMAQDTITLDQIMAMSPGLLNAKAGDILPNVSLNALDTITALAALAAVGALAAVCAPAQLGAKAALKANAAALRRS